MAKDSKYTRFDAAYYLEDLDDVAAYLEIALQESAEDPTAVPRALGVIARSQNMNVLARRVGVSRDGLYKALGRRQPDMVDHPEGTRSALRTAHGRLISPMPGTHQRLLTLLRREPDASLRGLRSWLRCGV